MNFRFPWKDLFGNTSILVSLFLIFAVNGANGRYPEVCAIHDDKFCYNILNIPAKYTAARTTCQELGGIPDVHEYPENVNKALEERGKDIYWIFRSFETKYCYGKQIGTTAEFSCRSILPAICVIPLKNCTLSDLRLSIPNADFENCKNIYLPSEDITINCREGYILKKSFVRCNRYGCRKANTVSCHFDGKWSNIPECKAGCHLKLDAIPINAFALEQKHEYDVGENVTFFCRENFISLQKHPVTSMVVTCLQSGSWSDSMPSCVPVEHLSYHYDYFHFYHFKMKLTIGDKVKLNCTLESPAFQRLNKSVTWFRDQVELNNMKGGQIFFNETDFSLNLLNFSREDEGVYICVVEDRSTSSVKTIPWSYQVSLARQCSQPISELLLMLTLQEDTYKIIRCPAKSYIYKVRWFKDGQRIWGNDHYIPMPDGSLFFTKISKAVAGTYVCTFNDIQSFCEGKSQIMITVKPAIDCGTLERNSNGRPWLATLWKVGEINPFCYATLIKSNWLITVASCLVESDGKENPGLFVKLGTTPENAALYDVQEVKLHPNYSSRLHLNDIALVKLTNHVVFTDDIHPICFLKSDLHSDHCTDFKSGTVTGLGHFTSIKGIANLKIKSETLNIVTKSDCNKIVQNTLPDYMFCAKAMNNSQIFAGDRGSPFEIMWRNRWHLVGVMNWGDTGAMKFGSFDYFSKLTMFQNWIHSTMYS